jgi:hypothetical protein
MSPLASHRWSKLLGAAGAASMISALALGSAASARGSHEHQGGGDGQVDGGRAKHVLLLSIDGLHQSDLDWYVKHHPSSALASLVGDGVQFTGARTPVPSDSYPGIVGQVTGGNPRSTGIWYDDSFNHELLPAGTTSCAGVAPGVEVTYMEAADKDPTALDAGQGLSGLPDNILNMTGDATSVLDPKQLPVSPTTCKPVYPHSYLKVNTIFEVARAAGLRTAWSDKHAAYEVVNGPSGTGVQDLFAPEINSDAPTPGSSGDWTSLNSLTQRYDSYKVKAIINEIRGYDHSGTTAVGTPAIFGMNFQTISTAEKLPTSDGQPGGYLADGVTPGPVLSGALDYIDAQVGAFRAALAEQHLDRSTAIVLSAKHGQSPDTPSALTRIPDGPIIDGLNAAWKAAHPASTKPLVAFSVNDDGMMIWLNERSQAAADFAKRYLLAHNGTGNDINGNPKAYTASGLKQVFAGHEAADYFGVPVGDARRPDVFGIAQYGSVYTGKKGKIAEHGGANPQDLSVPLVVSGGPVASRGTVDGPVETTQIAPTILQLLGLDPQALKSVQIEHTQALPVSAEG